MIRAKTNELGKNNFIPKTNLLAKTINRQINSNQINQYTDQIKTRRSYFQFSRNPVNLASILKDLEKNVKQLKVYHSSLQKNTGKKILKSNSLNQLNKFRCNSKSIEKRKIIKNVNLNTQKGNFINKTKTQELRNLQQNRTIDCTRQKYQNQNASTMLSICNGDIDEIKKAYQNAYGRDSSNIVDLYNFFKKNIEKTRFHGSMEMSGCPNHEQSQDVYSSKQFNQRRSNQLLNVIIEDKRQKQNIHDPSNDFQNECSQIHRRSVQKNPTMERIFKNGSSDMANVFELVKNRRLSVKAYINRNKDKQNCKFESNLLKVSAAQQSKLSNKRYQKIGNVIKQTKNVYKDIQEQVLKDQISSPILKRKEEMVNLNFPNKYLKQKKQIKNEEQKIYEIKSSKKIYLPENIYKKSGKSSIKKSKKKEYQDLDENISEKQIGEFITQPQFKCQKKKFQQNRLFEPQFYDDVHNYSQINQNSPKKRPKYYAPSIAHNKDDSLEGCSISAKSSSRIIELDFIPLDL